MERFSEYQRESRKTWNLVLTDHPIVYPTLGLVNEAGEVRRGRSRRYSAIRAGRSLRRTAKALMLELGDVLWYLAQICTELGISLDDVAEATLRSFDRDSSEGLSMGKAITGRPEDRRRKTDDGRPTTDGVHLRPGMAGNRPSSVVRLPSLARHHIQSHHNAPEIRRGAG